MTLISDAPEILADTGPFCRLAAAGEGPLEAAAEYLRPNVRIVEDVRKELRRRSRTPLHARLARLALLDVPEGDAVTITDRSVLADIATILDGRRRSKPGHEDEDRGEVSTALAAAALGWPVLMDDGFGKRLAAQRRVAVFTTQDLAIELAATDRLGARFAFGLYRIVYSGATRTEFDARAAALRRSLP